MPEGQDGISRYVFVAGAASYVHDADDYLPSVYRDLERIEKLFRALGAQVAGNLPDPTQSQLLSDLEAWVKDPARNDSDLLIFYYSGHGGVSGGTYYLSTSDTHSDRLESTAVAAERLARIFNGSSLKHFVIILDACDSGWGSDDLAAGFYKVFREQPAAAWSGWLITATRRRGSGDPEGAFAEVFASAVHDERLGGAKQRYLSIDALIGSVNAGLERRGLSQRATFHALSAEDPSRAFPNPRYVPGLADSSSILDLDQWDAAARGVATDARPGWYFTGRQRVIDELAGWLTGPPEDQRVRIVTGRPGSGKTAVLGRLVTLSSPGYRSRVPARLSGDVSRLPVGIIDAAMIATGKTTETLLGELAAAARSSGPVSPPVIAQAIRRQHDRFTIVVDAVNEAVSPDELIGQVLRPILEQAGSASVRLLVGMQRPLLTAFGRDTVVIDLDEDGYYSREDVIAFAEQKLLSGRPEDPAPYRENPELARKTAVAIAAKAGRNFLMARLYAELFAGRREPADLQDRKWQAEPATVSAAFDASLDRLGADTRWLSGLLLPLAFAQGQGLPWEGIWSAVATRLTGRPYDDADILRLLNVAGGYVVETVESGRSAYRLHHQEFARHLQSRIDSRTAHARITETLMAQVPRDAAGSPDWSAAHPYIRHHLAAHAAEAGRLDDFITDPHFMAVNSPGGLLPFLHHVRGTMATRSAGTYRIAANNLRLDDLPHNLAALELAARCADDGATIDQLTHAERLWMVPWARWRSYPHQRLAQRDGAVRALASMPWKDSGGPVDEVLAAYAQDGSLDIMLCGPAYEGRLAFQTRECEWPALAMLTSAEEFLVMAVKEGERLEIRFQATGDDITVSAQARGGGFGGDPKVTLARTGDRLLAAATEGYIYYSGDGFTTSRRTIRVVDLTQGKVLWERAGWHLRPVLAAELGGRIVVATASTIEERCDGQAGHILAFEPGEGRCVGAWSTELAPEGNSGTADGTLTAVQLTTAWPGITVLAGTQQGWVWAWDLESRTMRMQPLKVHDYPVTALAAREVDTQVVIASADEHGHVRLTDARTSSLIGPVRHGHEGPVTSVAISRSFGRPVVVSAGQDGSVRSTGFWNASPPSSTSTADDHAVTAAAIARLAGSEPVAVTGGTDGTIRALDLTSGMVLNSETTGHAVTAIGTGLLSEQAVAVSAHADGSVRTWSLPHLRPVQHLASITTQSVEALRITPRGFLLISHGAGVTLINLRTGQQSARALRQRPWRKNGPRAINVDDEGIVTAVRGGSYGRLHFHFIADKKGRPEWKEQPWFFKSAVIRPLERSRHGDDLSAIDLASNGKQLFFASGKNNGSISFWDCVSNRGWTGFGLHDSIVTHTTVTWVEGIPVVVSAGTDGTILATSADGHECCTIELGTSIKVIAVSGEYILVAARSGLLLLQIKAPGAGRPVREGIGWLELV